jgi:hypothetical protein
VRRGEIQGRVDAFFHRPYFKILEKRLEQYEHVYDLCDAATGLTNGDHGGLTYTTSGVRYLRGQSVNEYGLDLTDVLYISDNEHQRMKRSEVVSGDVLFTIAGSIGNACVVTQLPQANINQAIVRVRPSGEILPQFLADFLNSEYGKFQSSRLANGGVQLNINFSEVGRIRVATPPLAQQRELVDAMEAARVTRRNKLVEADALLAGMDAFLLETLALSASQPPQRKAFAVRAGQLTNALAAERYAAIPLEKMLSWSTRVADAVELVEARTVPSRSGA